MIFSTLKQEMRKMFKKKHNLFLQWSSLGILGCNIYSVRRADLEARDQQVEEEGGHQGHQGGDEPNLQEEEEEEEKEEEKGEEKEKDSDDEEKEEKIQVLRSRKEIRNGNKLKTYQRKN